MQGSAELNSNYTKYQNMIVNYKKTHSNINMSLETQNAYLLSLLGKLSNIIIHLTKYDSDNIFRYAIECNILLDLYKYESDNINMSFSPMRTSHEINKDMMSLSNMAIIRYIANQQYTLHLIIALKRDNVDNTTIREMIEDSLNKIFTYLVIIYTQLGIPKDIFINKYDEMCLYLLEHIF